MRTHAPRRSLAAFLLAASLALHACARAQETTVPPPSPEAPPQQAEPEPEAKPKAKPKAKSKPAPAKSSTRKRDAKAEEPAVLTPDQVRARRRSPFLAPPGSDDRDSQYEGEDPRDLPPWSRVSFFGINARGRFFIYVLDQSGSMVDDDRLTRATIELRRSVAALQSPQQFEVIFYNDESTTMPGGPIPRPADQRHKGMLTTWLRLIEPDGGTNPRQAVQTALALRPDAVFLLSDGDFPGDVVEAIARANPRKIPIHCIDLAGGLAGDELKRIAEQSGGRYASRPGSLHHAGAGR